MTAYQELESRFCRHSLLNQSLEFLHWDTSAMMPAGGATSRADQIACLRGLAHAMLSDPALPALLEEAGQEKGLSAWQAANLREMRRDFIHANALPADLVEALSKAASTCEMAWRSARLEDDFASVTARLEDVLVLVREVAAAKAAVFGCSPYDALLDEYEPGMSSDQIDGLFASLSSFLPDFTQRAMAHQANLPPLLPLEGRFEAADQRALGLRLMAAAGFDFDHGRLDESLHPFCGGASDDVRITTRYDHEDFSSCLMAVLHETGHALYEQNLPKQWRHQPVGRARSMGFHESQSLIIEMQACRSLEFIEFAAPLIREAFNASGPAFEAENLYRHLIRVCPGAIRVDADEVTYPAHVILRYRLEKALIDGALRVCDLPGAWNDGMAELLGYRPVDDREGVLQDIHWYEGAFGYFPTYTLGALCAAQLFAAAEAENPALRPSLAKGDFTPLTTWLETNIHAAGSRLDTATLMEEATGASVSVAPFTAHLERRYLGGAS